MCARMPVRFGNEAFVTWYDKVSAELSDVIERTLLPFTKNTDEEKKQHREMIGEVDNGMVEAILLLTTMGS